MDKSSLLVVEVGLAVFGASVAAGHPAWGTFTGIAIILLAAGLAAGTLPLDSQAYFDERIGPSQRISNRLITLSSAAIVAIYAAGYHRTSSAAHRFDSQTSQQRTSATIVGVAPPPGADEATSEAPPPPAAPSPKKNSARTPVAPRKTQPSDSRATSPPLPRSKNGLYLPWRSCPHRHIKTSLSL